MRYALVLLQFILTLFVGTETVQHSSIWHDVGF